MTHEPTVFDHVLWYRATKNVRWQAVAWGTRRECVAAVGCGGRRNGEWRIAEPHQGKPDSSRGAFHAASIDPEGPPEPHLFSGTGFDQ